MIAGTAAFIKIVDIATSDDKEFITVDGFASQAFDKILTPEANKVLSKEQQQKTLAPDSYSYAGMGVFTFPVRSAKKLRITILAESPTPALYERLHLIMQEVVTTTKQVKSSKKGLF